MKKFFLTLLFLSFNVLLAQQSDDVYYPLKVGYKWTYTWGTPENEQVIKVTQFDDDYNAYMVTEILKLGTALPMTTDVLVDKRKTRVLKIGSRGGLLNTDWNFSSQVVLEFPLKEGKTWKDESGTFPIQYTVVGFVDLRVEAGNFSNVCKIKKAVYDAKGKRAKVSLQYFQYYAPNVGLIKEEIINPQDKTPKTFRELTDYKIE